MFGAIIGDIIGSPYEFGSGKTKHFPLFLPECRPTDDSVMTIAEAFFGIPQVILEEAMEHVDDTLMEYIELYTGELY